MEIVSRPMLDSLIVNPMPRWDYLVLTASNHAQAESYRALIRTRTRLGLISDVRHVLVVPDPGGRRIGSGGSTVHALASIIDQEIRCPLFEKQVDPRNRLDILDRLRVLIVHAGGDSRRLPPYGPFGKVFIPVPGNKGEVLGTTLFDRLFDVYLKLPLPIAGRGQVVVASGDVLPDFRDSSLVIPQKGITGIGTLADPEVAKNHGVYICREDGRVIKYLQKPSTLKQNKYGAISYRGQVVLDVGTLIFTSDAAKRLLRIFGGSLTPNRKLTHSRMNPVANQTTEKGLDIYREICCALGTETRIQEYLEEVRDSGSQLPGGALKDIFLGLRGIPFHVYVIPRIRFLHFGTLQDLLKSGRTLLSSASPESCPRTIIAIDTQIDGRGSITGKQSWVEGCRIESPLHLAGSNFVVGADIRKPISMPRGRCLDLIEARGRRGQKGWFVRFYDVADVLNRPANTGGSLCGTSLRAWLESMGAQPSDIWAEALPESERTAWNARVFPFLRKSAEYLDWLFLLRPGTATTRQITAWKKSERYSLEEMSKLADQASFHSRRHGIRGEALRESRDTGIGYKSQLSAKEIGFLVDGSKKGRQSQWISAIFREALNRYRRAKPLRGSSAFEVARILHTLGTILKTTAERAEENGRMRGRSIASALLNGLTSGERNVLNDLGIAIAPSTKIDSLGNIFKDAAFRHIGRVINKQEGPKQKPPRSVLRSDEIVWGRVPARLDLGGGWTDTPPYSLEHGGCVINAAVDLNGQAPIQAYARIISDYEVRINSIDHSARTVIKHLEELRDYRNPGDQFALAKAALALAGFSPEAACWPAGAWPLERMLRNFGGGIEITTLAAIPSGSGLGTSSIMGAALISVIGKMIGLQLAPRNLFYAVLKLEQELTTGGGWQDQIGGAVGGVKLVETERGIVPYPRIRPICSDLLDPSLNGGRTLLYYTGLRRLAKNILRQVVGSYLDRDRRTLATMSRLHAFPPLMAEAMTVKNAAHFGELIETAWKLNVDLDPEHTTPVIEDLKERIRPYVLGSKLMGAGGGGFMLMACKSPRDAKKVKRLLEKDPLNDRSRFFDYRISNKGLIVTVC